MALVPSLQGALKRYRTRPSSCSSSRSWARGGLADVSAEALESVTVAAVDDDLGVAVDAADLGDRVVRGGATHEGRSDEFCGLASRGDDVLRYALTPFFRSSTSWSACS